jgi:hypothetical protein
MPLSCRVIDFTPLTPPFLLNSIDLILHERLRKSLFELKQAPALALSLIAPMQMD